jgi:hypothetical protein
MDVNEYHIRNGHLCEKYCYLKSKKEGINITGKFAQCIDCLKGKMKKKSIPKISNYCRSTKLFGRIYIDTSGPFPVPTIGHGHRYMVLIVDDYSRMKFLYTIHSKTKENILSVFQKFYIEEVLSRQLMIGIVRSDNGKEYDNAMVNKWLLDHDILREFTSSYTPQQNAVVEGSFKVIKQLMLILLIAAGLSVNHLFLWGEAAKYATALINEWPTEGNTNRQSAIDKARFSKLSHKYVFGSRSQVLVHDAGLLEERTKEAIFVGTAQNRPSDELRFLVHNDNSIINGRSYYVIDGDLLFLRDSNEAATDIENDKTVEVEQLQKLLKIFYPDQVDIENDECNVELEDYIRYENLYNRYQYFDCEHGMLMTRKTYRQSIEVLGNGNDVSDSTSGSIDMAALLAQDSNNSGSRTANAHDDGAAVADVLSGKNLTRDSGDLSPPPDIEAEETDKEDNNSSSNIESVKDIEDESNYINNVDIGTDNVGGFDDEKIIGSIRELDPRGALGSAQHTNKWYGSTKPTGMLRSGKVYQKIHTVDSLIKIFFSDIITPDNYRQAMKTTESSEWEIAMKKELESLAKHETWELVPRPKDAPVVGSRWVFVIKHNSNGTIKRYKARFVCCGYSQTYGVDYFETFAPVVAIPAIRLMISIAVEEGWKIYQMDVETAFLNAEVKEVIYVKQAPGYEEKGKENYVYKLKKSLYGLKQSPRNWNDDIVKFFTSIKFRPLDSDCCLLVKQVSRGIIIVGLFVDDIIITGNEQKLIDEIKDLLKGKYVMQDLGELNQLLGMNIIRKDNKLMISQQVHIQRLIDNYDLSKIYTSKIPTPVDTYAQVINTALDDKNNEIDNETDYRSIIGSLMYLANCSRPDIANITRYLSSFVSNPRKIHIVMVMKVLKYLQSTITMGIIYQQKNDKNYNKENNLQCHTAAYNIKYDKDYTKKENGEIILKANDFKSYSDASWGDNYIDGTSNSGICIFHNRNLIIWKSIKQRQVAGSSTHSEYIAMSIATDELLWLNKILIELNMIANKSLMCHDKEAVDNIKRVTDIFVLQCDNSAAICIGNKNSSTKRSRHININFHNVRQAVQDKIIELRYVNTKDNIADFFTKCLDVNKFQSFRKQFMEDVKVFNEVNVNDEVKVDKVFDEVKVDKVFDEVKVNKEIKLKLKDKH